MTRTNLALFLAALIVPAACSSSGSGTPAPMDSSIDEVDASDADALLDTSIPEDSTTPPSDGTLPPDGTAPPPDGPPSDGDAPAPTSCATEADCTASGACPIEAKLGCTCADTPSGKRCVPKCSTSTDCPDTSKICGGAGICVDPGGGPDGGKDAPPPDGPTDAMDDAPPKDGGGGETGPASCATLDDCKLAGACPADATLGCSCADTPSGKKCVPKCGTSTDCPDKSKVCGAAGVCVDPASLDGGADAGGGG